MMEKIRSFAFTVCFYTVTLILFVLMLPTMFMTRKGSLFFPVFWTKMATVMVRVFCGVKVRVEGLENLPKKNGYIVASKHQSALETTLFHRLIPYTFYVLKKELMWLPLVGFYFLKTGCIPIDRKGGATTMRKMLTGVKSRLAEGMNLVIFPEGTRTAPGTKKPYSPGVAFLYEQCGVPVVPVALNSGYCWPKNKMIKHAGTVTVRFLKPIEPGLQRRVFLDELYRRIEDAQDTLPNPFEGK
ncbi:MAG: 1-acyl-sn-glycerol-3-phosphate acyltransferase [Alphaproteobacteria bacterium]|nr:1-acyl-sn-glycerol-3-phosphate acyltransferase [Alphaproteobacteria bacterium]